MFGQFICFGQYLVFEKSTTVFDFGVVVSKLYQSAATIFHEGTGYAGASPQHLYLIYLYWLQLESDMRSLYLYIVKDLLFSRSRSFSGRSIL